MLDMENKGIKIKQKLKRFDISVNKQHWILEIMVIDLVHLIDW